MWRTDRDRTDDPRSPDLETERLSRDEYDRPRYGSPSLPQSYDGGRTDRSPGPPPDRYAAQPAQADLANVRVHQVMTRRVTSVHPATSVERAARLMEECDCGALPIVGDNGVLVGMLTDRDIALRIVARGREARNAIVADCMTERVFACHANESVPDCMRQMARRQVRRMPIVDERGRLIGMVSQADLARHAGHHALRNERLALTDVICAVSEPVHRGYR